MSDISVSELGEFGLIARIVARLAAAGRAVLLGPGDDAAVVAAPRRPCGRDDRLLVEGVHFRRDWSTAYDVGRKAAARRTSPTSPPWVPRRPALLVGLAAPGDLPLSLGRRSRGRACATSAPSCGAAVVGGDVVSRRRW